MAANTRVSESPACCHNIGIIDFSNSIYDECIIDRFNAIVDGEVYVYRGSMLPNPPRDGDFVLGLFKKVNGIIATQGGRAYYWEDPRRDDRSLVRAMRVAIEDYIRLGKVLCPTRDWEIIFGCEVHKNEQMIAKFWPTPKWVDMFEAEGDGTEQIKQDEQIPKDHVAKEDQDDGNEQVEGDQNGAGEAAHDKKRKYSIG